MIKYEEFTKRSHVTKALEFALIPQGKTAQYIIEKGDREYDKNLYSSLERLKPVVDSFIKDISRKALENFEYDFSSLHLAITGKDKKKTDREEKAAIKELLKQVDAAMPTNIKTTQIKSAKFMQDSLREYVLHTSDESIKKDEALKDIEDTAGCLPLFSKFLTSRITALRVWMPERVIKNFSIYTSNIDKINEIIENNIAPDYTDELAKMADISYYNSVLTQNKIDGYNSVVQGTSNEGGVTQKGINMLVNEYNLKIRNEKLDRPYIKKLSVLYKQILSPAEKKFTIDSISSDDEARDVIKKAWKEFVPPAEELKNILENKLKASDGKGIFIKGSDLHKISHILTGEHSYITDCIKQKELTEINEMLAADGLRASMRKELEKRAEIITNIIAKKEYEFSALDEYINTDDDAFKTIDSMFFAYTAIYSQALDRAKISYRVIEGSDILKKRRIKGDRHVQEMLVDFFAELTHIREIIRLLSCPYDADADIAFYDEFNDTAEKIRMTYKAENLVRNYITKSTKAMGDAVKKQTCFGSPARFRTSWWNGEDKFAKDHAAIIRHEDRYYYFILSGDSKPVDIREVPGSGTGFLTLKKGQKAYMMLPKVVFTMNVVPYFKENKDAMRCVIDNGQVIGPVTVTRDVYNIYINGLFKKEAVTSGNITEEEYAENIRKLIDVYKQFAYKYVQYQKFNLDALKENDTYADIGEFFAEVDTCTSRLSWTEIDFKQIENLVEYGKAYIFLINNKFLYTGIDGKEQKNTYTRTFLSILSKTNMDKTTILLNSNPAVYFRPAVLENKVTHKIGSILVNKRTRNGEHIPNDIYEAIYKMANNKNVSEEDERKALEYQRTHDVVSFEAKEEKTYRANYRKDYYYLQITYTKNNDISDRVNDRLNDRILKDMEDGFNMVTVARSTNDLCYVMVMTNELKILEEKSLNTIGGINYHDLLLDAYKGKLKDKKAWVYDSESADLKSAYIELAISEIVKLAKQYNAIIVVEGISDNVKDKYSFLDNQIFKSFEGRLAARLSDMTYKDIKEGRPGSSSNPLQLANNNGNTYQDGILFFVNAGYTRGVDTESGFVNLFDFTRIGSIASKRAFFSKMDNISVKDDRIMFEFDYKNYPVKFETDKTKWKIQISGGAEIFDKEKKTGTYINNIVCDKILPVSGGADLSGNLSDKMEGKFLPGVFIEELFRWFRFSLIGIHRKTSKAEDFFRSPIDGKECPVCHTSAYNIGRKLLFRLEYAGDAKDFTKEWVNYIQ